MLRKENLAPQVNGPSFVQPSPQMDRTYRTDYGGLDLSQLPPYLSMMITNPGAKEDIMNMGMDELDQLKHQNESRIKEIEDRYFQKRDEIKKVKEIC